MRKLNILKTILDVAWFFSILCFFGIIIMLSNSIFIADNVVHIKMKGQEFGTGTILSKIVVLANLISGMLFIYSIYFLRKVVGLFQKREIFNTKVVHLFNLIGKLTVASSVISSVSLFIYNIIERKYKGLSFDFGYESFLISISVGLLFMVISEIFKIANNMKEENELTI